MKVSSFLTSVVAFLCRISTVSIAIPVDLDLNASAAVLGKRALSVNSPPQAEPVCGGHIVEVDDIVAAMTRGNEWATSKPPIQMGSGRYPHIFKNFEGLSFPNCGGLELYEYPVLRSGANPWEPGKNTKLKQEPDRVIFSPDGNKTTTYCGTITHTDELTPNGKPGVFVLCI